MRRPEPILDLRPGRIVRESRVPERRVQRLRNLEHAHQQGREGLGAQRPVTDAVQHFAHGGARAARSDQPLRDVLQLRHRAQERPHHRRPFGPPERQRRLAARARTPARWPGHRPGRSLAPPRRRGDRGPGAKRPDPVPDRCAAAPGREPAKSTKPERFRTPARRREPRTRGADRTPVSAAAPWCSDSNRDRPRRLAVTQQCRYEK